MTTAKSAIGPGLVWQTGPDQVPHPSGFQQWLALTGRTVRIMVTKGELVIAAIIPLIFTLSFYLPLKYVMQFRVPDYAQFVMPIIMLQSMGFAAMTAAQRSAFEAMTGLTTRIQTMPVSALAPLGARLTSAFVRASVALAASIGYGYMIGFRFHGVVQGTAFIAFTLAVGLVLATGGDALGGLTKSPEAVSQAITLPYLILGMLSSGFSPASSFPDWIEPFVRNQPITHFSNVLHDLAVGPVAPNVLWPAMAWLVGLGVVLVPLAIWAGTRRR